MEVADWRQWWHICRQIWALYEQLQQLLLAITVVCQPELLYQRSSGCCRGLDWFGGRGGPPCIATSTSLAGQSPQPGMEVPTTHHIKLKHVMKEGGEEPRRGGHLLEYIAKTVKRLTIRAQSSLCLPFFTCLGIQDESSFK